MQAAKTLAYLISGHKPNLNILVSDAICPRLAGSLLTEHDQVFEIILGIVEVISQSEEDLHKQTLVNAGALPQLLRMKGIAVLLVALLFAAIASVEAYPSTVYGVDVSTSVSQSQWSCLKGDNLTFAVIRAWHSTGTPDTNCPGTVAAAWAGGLTAVDVYMFPCPSCGNPAGQVSNCLAFLKQHNVKFGTFWFDIEGPGLYWGSDQGSNAQFFAALASELKNQGVKGGVYTSKSQWVPIMGSYTGGSQYPLWYADYDGEPSFSDFSPFNGWTKPAMKQFTDQGSKCSVSYDINWYPPS